MLARKVKKTDDAKSQLKVKVKEKTKLTEEETNIFNLGTLIQLETHSWQGFKKIKNAEILDKKIKIQDKERIKHSKNLIDRSELAEINSAITEARNTIKKYAFPFPLSGIDFVAKDKVTILNEELMEIQSRFNKAVKNFANVYDELVSKEEETLGDFFDISDYPGDIKTKYSLVWRFFDMSLPKKVTDELYEEETRKFQNLMQETKKMGVIALREGFQKILTNITDTLTGKLDGEERRIRQDSIDKITAFFDEFQSKNIFKDNDLENLVIKAKEVVKGVKSKNLKDDNSLAEKINEQLLKVSNELTKSTEKYKRKMVL